MNNLTRMDWDHPHIGRIEEVLCRQHDSEVLAALRVLGIGCGATDERDPAARCLRCQQGDTQPRVFLRTPATRPAHRTATHDDEGTGR